MSTKEIVVIGGIAIVSACLIKGLVKDVSNNRLMIIILGIVAFIFIIMKETTSKCKIKENYQITDTPLVDSIYDGPDNEEHADAEVIVRKPAKFDDKDLDDLENIMGIDKDVLRKLIENEKKAKDVIRKTWRDEMVYTDSNPFNTVPLGTQLYGYTYLPPENWFRAYERPPVCVTDSPNNVMPIVEQDTIGLMQFDAARNISGPMDMNLRYIKKKLNKNK
jgi:hypothetical protein